ncbi:F-box/LRR-repeat protein 2 [Acipenser oxyrinchus oxyrinchus]|uniref:F-box/LRR-repeat protein 2 n=1 Tax=Acipenser oxyrinchus oxyrinchus TaxID=40147 RepID=A0AAD8D9A9_ACIOX|nr:F-box/LRR-repeat protein 2 [Acipenser oxyrinchus oxyrinchus]
MTQGTLNNSTNTHCENRQVISGAGCTFEMDTPELPVEIITYILSFLQGPDRKEASLVCNIWYTASQNCQFKVPGRAGGGVQGAQEPGRVHV